MKGVVFTLTGEVLAASSPAELINPLNRSPKVRLKLFKTFAFEEDDSERHEDDTATLPPNPSSRKEAEKGKDKDDASSENSTSSSGMSAANTRNQQTAAPAPPPTRIRRPSIRSSRHASWSQPMTLRTSALDPAGLNVNGNGASTSNGRCRAVLLPNPHLQPSGNSSNLAVAAAIARSLPISVPSHPLSEYDFADGANFPGAFLKRVDRAVAATSRPSSNSKRPQSTDGGSGLESSSSKVKRRLGGNSGSLLRAVGTPSTSSSVVPMKMNERMSRKVHLDSSERLYVERRGRRLRFDGHSFQVSEECDVDPHKSEQEFSARGFSSGKRAKHFNFVFRSGEIISLGACDGVKYIKYAR